MSESDESVKSIGRSSAAGPVNDAAGQASKPMS